MARRSEKIGPLASYNTSSQRILVTQQGTMHANNGSHEGQQCPEGLSSLLMTRCFCKKAMTVYGCMRQHQSKKCTSFSAENFCTLQQLPTRKHVISELRRFEAVFTACPTNPACDYSTLQDVLALYIACHTCFGWPTRHMQPAPGDHLPYIKINPTSNAPTKAIHCTKAMAGRQKESTERLV